MAAEIIISETAIQEAEKKLDSLRSSVENRSFSVSFAASKGDMADSLCDMAGRISDLRSKLALLYANTAKALALTRTTFNETDNTIANYFTVFWEREDEK